MCIKVTIHLHINSPGCLKIRRVEEIPLLVVFLSVLHRRGRFKNSRGADGWRKQLQQCSVPVFVWVLLDFEVELPFKSANTYLVEDIGL